MELRIYRECKPFVISQRWGIKNPAYEQFGYSRHNGTDFLRYYDNREAEFPLYWGLDNCEVYFSGYEKNAGFCVKANSLDFYDFPDGKRARVNLILMHMKEQPQVTVGQILKVGTYLGLADNSGFSTGPHTHRNGRRVDKDLNLMDTNDASNSFDTMLYDTGIYAQDYNTLVQQTRELIEKLSIQLTALIKGSKVN